MKLVLTNENSFAPASMALYVFCWKSLAASLSPRWSPSPTMPSIQGFVLLGPATSCTVQNGKNCEFFLRTLSLYCPQNTLLKERKKLHISFTISFNNKHRIKPPLEGFNWIIALQGFIFGLMNYYAYLALIIIKGSLEPTREHKTTFAPSDPLSYVDGRIGTCIFVPVCYN